ncbi:MAG: TIGR03087 family PEP-CTERM/XrtA system glycosyltransferase [Pseudomonadota bacterium]
MTVRGDLLFLAHRIPYPPNKGDKIRSWHLLRHLSTNWRVHLGCFIDDPYDAYYVDQIAAVTASHCCLPLDPRWRTLVSARGLLDGRPLSFAYYDSRPLRNFIAQVHREHRPRAQLAFSSAMAPFLIPTAEAIPTLIDFCDCDSEKWDAYARAHTNPVMARVYAREAKTVRKAETALINDAAASFAITSSEAALFGAGQTLEKPVSVFRNGVDTAFFDPGAAFVPLEETGPGPSIVFVGAMDYAPNVEAVTWFSKTVWPLIKTQHTGVTFSIVGANPVAAVRQLADDPAIVVTGRVPDVRPWIANAALVVAPLQIGRGLQNKVLEAMAMARPVVVSTAAAEGIDAQDQRHFVKTADVDAMAAAIHTLLSNPEKAKTMGMAARRYVEAQHSWTSALSAVDDALATVTARFDQA